MSLFLCVVLPTAAYAAWAVWFTLTLDTGK